MRVTIYIYLILFPVLWSLNVNAQIASVIDHRNWDPSKLSGDALDEIREWYIMFGHQSVGLNMIEGLEILAAEQPDRYTITIYANPAVLNQPGLIHWINGENFDPHGKIDAFAEKMKSKDSNDTIWGNRGTIAFFKFCYVDFNSLDIKIDSLFQHYIKSMESLEKNYPGCKFVHVTEPLTGLIWPSDKQRNVNRHLYNEMLRAYVDSTASILYDLADLQAFDENGDYQSFEYDGETYPMMWYDADDPENNGYSCDGGHLNTKGKRHMAASLWSLWGALSSFPVPVELISFKAEFVDSGVELLWTTSCESNNLGFRIERSDDNKRFYEIGFVKGSGTLNRDKTFRFVDENPSANTAYYRLGQIDFDGDIHFSTSIKVEPINHVLQSFRLFQNRPNPFNASTRIDFFLPYAQNVSLVIYDVHGKEVLRLVDDKNTGGRQTIFWNADQFPSGLYIYKIQTSDFLDMKKMVLLK